MSAIAASRAVRAAIVYPRAKDVMLLLLTACRLGGPLTDDFAGPDPQGGCPELDCRDAMVVHLLEPDGATPVTSFTATVTVSAFSSTFTCPTTDEDPFGGACLSDGFMVWGTPESADITIVEALDGPWWRGTVKPTYEDPYATDECGPYCQIGELTVTLEACDGCG